MANITPPIDPDTHETPHDQPVEWWYFAGELQVGAAPACYGFEFTIAQVTILGQVVYNAYFAFVEPQTSTSQGSYLGYALTSSTAYSPSTNPPPEFAFVFEPNAPNDQTWRCSSTVGPGVRQYTIAAGFQTPPAAGAIPKRRSINLTLSVPTQAHAPLLHGNQGVVDFFGDRMGFYSRSRLRVLGGIEIDSNLYTLSGGTAWMDHEWGSINLSRRWKYLNAHLDDGRDLVHYIVRKNDGSANPIESAYVYDAGTWQPTTVTMTQIRDWHSIPIEHSFNVTTPSIANADQRPARDDQLRQPCNWPYPSPLVFWEGYSEIERTNGTRMGSGFLEIGGRWLPQ